MKKQIKISTLKLEYGKFSGGFKSLNDSQIIKIKGGTKRVKETNTECHNVMHCDPISGDYIPNADCV